MEDPIAFIPLDRRMALAAGSELPARASGACLFADISGFTPLTEALARSFGPRRGAEELTHHLNQVYTALIRQVHQYGGSVIGFSGDAITCWFDDSGYSFSGTVRACQSALCMQQAMAAFAAIEHPAGTVTLAVKTAVAGGSVRRLVVGDPEIQRIDVAVGELLERVAVVEHHTREHELVLDEATATGLAGEIQGHWRTVDDGRFFVVSRLNRPVPPVPVPSAVVLPEDVQRAWLLPAVYDRLRAQEGRFLAELRPATALFLKFTGLDFEHDPNIETRLNQYVCWVQAIVARLEGALIQLTTGDKGSYLYIVFGAPITHDDDVLRAIDAALALRRSATEFSFIDSVQIGISQGRMRVGPYGSATRRTYGVLGDEVNLAARLMTRAAPDEILVSDRIADSARRRYHLQSLGTEALKGKRDAVEIYRLEGIRTMQDSQFPTLYDTELVGRETERNQITQVLEPISGGADGRVLRLVGEAGVGKSHLASDILKVAGSLGFEIAIGSCQSTDRSIAYAAAGQIFRQILGIRPNQDSTSVLQKVQARLAADDWSALQARLPVLGDLLGTEIADTVTTAALDPQLRQEALVGLAQEIVKAFARQRPLLLLLEDAHWIDEASWQVIKGLIRTAADSPCVLLITERPVLNTADPYASAWEQLPQPVTVNLRELSGDGIGRLVGIRLGAPASKLLVSLIEAKTQGNPFFAEELVDALQESGLLYEQDGIWTVSPELLKSLQESGCVRFRDDTWELLPDAPLAEINLGLPDSIHGIILSRLDRLPEEEKLTVKVASVIGRVFDFDLLAKAHPAHPPEDRLRRQIDTLSSRDFARLEAPPPHLAYIFKHNITQEVVYDTLLDRQQQELHQAVAEKLEQLRPEAVEQLAYHFRHGDLTLLPVRSKAMAYLSQAGSKAQKEYANETALSYFEHALALEMRWPWLVAKVDLLHVLGRREEELATLEVLDGLPDTEFYQLQTLWARYYEAISDYPAALASLEQARQAAQEEGDVQRLVSVLGRRGLIHWRQGQYDESAEAYNQALELLANTEGHEQEEAEIRYGLGILHRQQGKFPDAQAELEKALALSRKLGNRPDEAKALAALASVAEMYGENPGAALTFNQRALDIRREIGDRSGEGSSLLALGQSYSREGRYAEALLACENALRIQQELADRWWEAIVWNQLGIIQLLTGAYPDARHSFESALAIVVAIQADVGIAYTRVNLGQIQRELGQFQAGRKAFIEGLRFAQEKQDLHLEAIARSDLGILFLATGKFEEAIASAEMAATLWEQVGTPNEKAADFATTAVAYLRLGQPKQAARYARMALVILDQCGGMGLDFPQRDYWRCAQVLYAINETAQADNALQSAHRILHEKARLISDQKMLLSFLENVSFHKEIQDAWLISRKRAGT